MITSLFSIFEPTSSTRLIKNWVIITIIIILVTPKYWMKQPTIKILINKIKNTLHAEFNTILGPINHKGFTVIVVTVFYFILLRNFTGLFPYVFNSTRHISITISLALPFWASLILFGWINQTTYIFAHLTPQSTPTTLIPFIVLIETIRRIIRPLTLAVRLIANIIAGHLLITLLGNQAVHTYFHITSIVLLVQLLLLTLELAVSVIQAYVFSVLLTLYTSEIINH